MNIINDFLLDKDCHLLVKLWFVFTLLRVYRDYHWHWLIIDSNIVTIRTSGRTFPLHPVLWLVWEHKYDSAPLFHSFFNAHHIFFARGQRHHLLLLRQNRINVIEMSVNMHCIYSDMIIYWQYMRTIGWLLKLCFLHLHVNQYQCWFDVHLSICWHERRHQKANDPEAINV